MSKIVAFDLDGVLLDTNDVIRDCYQQCGVLPPVNVLGAEGSSWLLDQCGSWDEMQRVRARKSNLYLDKLAQGVPRTLPPFIVAQWLHASGYELHVVTAAPPDTARLFVRYYVKMPRIFTSVVDNITPRDRMVYLESLGSNGVYVDDLHRDVVPSGWRFVHYQGESEVDIADMIIDGATSDQK